MVPWRRLVACNVRAGYPNFCLLTVQELAEGYDDMEHEQLDAGVAPEQTPSEAADGPQVRNLKSADHLGLRESQLPCRPEAICIRTGMMHDCMTVFRPSVAVPLHHLCAGCCCCWARGRGGAGGGPAGSGAGPTQGGRGGLVQGRMNGSSSQLAPKTNACCAGNAVPEVLSARVCIAQLQLNV